MSYFGVWPFLSGEKEGFFDGVWQNMSLRRITIDKTAEMDRMLADHLALCLSGMPGVGRKTAVRILLDKHQEVNAVYCFPGEVENVSTLEKREKNQVNWYLIRKPEKGSGFISKAGFWKFVQQMPKNDRILLAVDGLIPEELLEFVWNGIMAVVMPETFWFTEAETCRYLKQCGSNLRYREVQYLTGGWAGCIAMLVRLEKQLKEKWTVWELGRRYEIRRYIQTQILEKLPYEERRMLRERAAFPCLNSELLSILWKDADRVVEENLFARGAMVYVPGKTYWYVQPALRIALEERAPEEMTRKAVEWYETHGLIQDAVLCCWYSGNYRIYRECLIRNYDRISFLHYDRSVLEGKSRKTPELLYLEWMDAFLQQDVERMVWLRKMAEKLWKDIKSEDNRQRTTEILLNIAYADPEISAVEWMELLNEKTIPGHPVRLYYMLGESVSFLSGIRDLSALFACGGQERIRYREIWEDRLARENQMPYRLAELEYEYQTDGVLMRSGKGLEYLDLVAADGDATWQIRLGMMYLAYLSADEEELRERVKKIIRDLYETLKKEETVVCRWNARALFYLAEARWGETEDLMQWIRETGGDIENEAGKTKFYLSAEVKINLFLGNFGRAESLLQTLIPYYERNKSWRWLAEALFQRGITELQKKKMGKALKTAAESIATANPYRYVRIYTGYGGRGKELLEAYKKWAEDTETTVIHKKRYQYGSVLKMSVTDWVDYIIRKAGRQKKYFPDLENEKQNIYRVEKLTVTEQMILRYLEKGYSNAVISEKMNIRLSTVKSHIYNIYKKLGVSTRVQAVQKAKSNGLI